MSHIRFIIVVLFSLVFSATAAWGQEDGDASASASEGQETQASGQEGQASQQDAGTQDTEQQEAQQALTSEEQEQPAQAITDVAEQTGLISEKLQLEYSLSYVHISNNQLFIEGFGLLPIIVVGEVNIQKLRRDLFVNTFTVRYMLTDKLELSLRVPWQYSIIRVSEAAGIFGGGQNAPANDEQKGTSSGLGDISGGLNYQLFSEGLTRPSMFLGVQFKARNGSDFFETEDTTLDPPTGSGFNSLRVNLSANKSAAPALLFGSLSYAYAFSRENVVFDPPGQGQAARLVDFDPGNNFSLSAGLAFSLNYKLSLNASFQQQVNFSSRLDGNKLPNSATNSISLRMGGVWRLEKTSIDLAVNAGLSEDAPDFRLDFRIPWRF